MQLVTASGCTSAALFAPKAWVTLVGEDFLAYHVTKNLRHEAEPEHITGGKGLPCALVRIDSSCGGEGVKRRRCDEGLNSNDEVKTRNVASVEEHGMCCVEGAEGRVSVACSGCECQVS